ncbi:hypothetical protein ROT00_11700 [Agromyces mediolanus]|uniref:hypothetical protein n=1 Tax=Agromyces mediolanus TaxID=41986 RepID=UPI003835AE7F
MPHSGEFRPPAEPTIGHVDLVALEQSVLPDGGPFPPSYRAFVRTAGWGRLFGLWLVYPPVRAGYADGWPGRTSRLTERFRAAFADGRAEGFDWMVEPDGDWPLAERLQVFAWSENGDALLWELGSRDEQGELVVWESRGLNSLHRLGVGLNTALAILRERREALAEGRPELDPLPGVRIAE